MKHDDSSGSGRGCDGDGLVFHRRYVRNAGLYHSSAFSKLEVQVSGWDKRPVEGAELFNAILLEGSQNQCQDDAQKILRARFTEWEPDPEIVSVLAHAIYEERKRKLNLHRQWTQLYGRERDRLHSLRFDLVQIQNGDGNPKEIARRLLKATSYNEGA